MTISSRFVKGSVAALGIVALTLPAFAQIGATVNTSINTNISAPGVKARAVGEASTSVKVNGENRGMSTTTKQDRIDDRMQNGENRGDSEVNARISALNKLVTRINSMKNLSADQKAAFSAEIQASVTDMNNLLAKLQSDSSTTTLRADLQSIAPDFRIYMLVMPQISLLSAVDRVNTIVGSLQTIQGKIQTRVSADASLSGNTTISGVLKDMSAKISDATSLSASAQTEVSGLKPDNGDKTVQASNTAALKDARTKIQSAQKDLAQARKDAGDLVKLIITSDKSLNASGSASTTVH